MVIGSIANDRMFYVLDSFFEGTITDTALVKSLSALKLGRQYVAITQKACDAVKIEREVQLLWMERQALKKASEQNRSNGHCICKPNLAKSIVEKAAFLMKSLMVQSREGESLWI